MAANMLRICHFQPKCLLKIPHQFHLPTRDSAHSAKHPKTGISANGQQAGLLPLPCGAQWRLSRPQLCRSKRPLPLGVAHAHQDRRTHSQPRPVCVCVCVYIHRYIYIYIYIYLIYIYQSDICMHKIPGIYYNICNVYTVHIPSYNKDLAKSIQTVDIF